MLGDDITIKVNAYDEMNIKIPVERIATRMKQTGHTGLVCLVGVQSNQFPRAMVLARRFRSQGVAVAIGGFHVSGCLAMLKDLTPELHEAVDLGVILYAGEAEEHFELNADGTISFDDAPGGVPEELDLAAIRLTASLSRAGIRNEFEVPA